GDAVTLRCEVDQIWARWAFIWSKDSNTESTEAATKTIDSVKVSDGGEYRCRARRRGLYTNYSEPVTLTIYGNVSFRISDLCPPHTQFCTGSLSISASDSRADLQMLQSERYNS
uniref:Ig-like domain-containing protein n=1 Tax=Sinocyclocheilus anshuiensis TaxID=1608454 RepID=A0A671MN06_9TELE